MTPMIRSGYSVYQNSYNLLCQLLRKVLVDGVRAGCSGDGGIGSVQFRACATLYALLLAHPMDQKGRCRSCRGRGPGVVFGWRRRCWVHRATSYWLRQPDEFLRSLMIREWGLLDQPQPDADAAPARDSGTPLANLEAPDVSPKIESEAGDPATQPVQTPAVPPIFTAPAGRPDLAHGGSGDAPDSPRPRRAPPEHPQLTLHPDRSLLRTEGIT